MYHVWDFELTLGNCNYFSKFHGACIDNGYKGFFVKGYGLQGYGAGWYYKLFQNPAFRSKVKARWKEVKPMLEKEIPDYIDSMYLYVKDAAERNFQRWNILGVWVWPNVEIPGSYNGEVRYMKQFYQIRLAWLDSEINKW